MTDSTQTCGEYAVEIAKPLDAEGKPISLDTTLLYDRDGRIILVNEFKFKINTETSASSWIAVAAYEGAKNLGTFMPQSLYLDKPDSIKQLAEDLNRMVNCKRGYGYSSPSCAYTGNSGSTCDGCKLKDSSDICSVAVIKDIAARVNRLCGDSE